MPLFLQLEAILFTAARPFTIKRLAELLDASSKDIEEALVEYEKRLESSALMIQRVGADILLVTRPEYADVVQKIAKDEVHGELTRAALEALTILAYRGPLTRPELEQIRGVHSSMILRNLLLRGLIDEKDDARLGQPTYTVTTDYVRHLGLQSLEDLPKYEELRGHSNVVDVLKDLEVGAQVAGHGAQEESADPSKQNVLPAASSEQPAADTNLAV